MQWLGEKFKVKTETSFSRHNIFRGLFCRPLIRYPVSGLTGNCWLLEHCDSWEVHLNSISKINNQKYEQLLWDFILTYLLTSYLWIECTEHRMNTSDRKLIVNIKLNESRGSTMMTIGAGRISLPRRATCQRQDSWPTHRPSTYSCICQEACSYALAWPETTILRSYYHGSSRWAQGDFKRIHWDDILPWALEQEVLGSSSSRAAA